MSKQLNFVLSGFLKLSDEDKKELHSLIKDYDSLPYTTEKIINESFIDLEKNSNSINFGPSSGPDICPVCGR